MAGWLSDRLADPFSIKGMRHGTGICSTASRRAKSESAIWDSFQTQKETDLVFEMIQRDVAWNEDQRDSAPERLETGGQSPFSWTALYRSFDDKQGKVALTVQGPFQCSILIKHSGSRRLTEAARGSNYEISILNHVTSFLLPILTRLERALSSGKIVDLILQFLQCNLVPLPQIHFYHLLIGEVT